MALFLFEPPPCRMAKANVSQTGWTRPMVSIPAGAVCFDIAKPAGEI
jgi:hypothetical protein